MYQSKQTHSLQGQEQSAQVLTCFMCMQSFVLDILWIAYARESGSEWAWTAVGSLAGDGSSLPVEVRMQSVVQHGGHLL